MKKFVIAVFTALLFGVNATLRCNSTNQQNNTLECVSDNNDNVLKKGLFSNHDKVEELVLRKCKITEILCDAFSQLTELQNLDLAYNELQELKPCIIHNLDKLTTLYLSYDKISALPSNSFAQLHNLQKLFIDGNGLKTLESDIFDSLINLKGLDLTNNDIDGNNLSPQIFANNKIMNTLYLSRNNMSKAPEDLLHSFQSLKFIFLDRCSLTRVPSFATKKNMKTLLRLILSNNHISSLDDPMTFNNLYDLEVLDLDGNLIRNIADNVFTQLKKLKIIILKHNQLKTISDNLFQNMPKLMNIDLSYNGIEVINLASFRNTPMENLNLEGNRLSFMPVNFYYTLIISGGKLKTFLFHNNPWQCACLREILQEVKSHNVGYNSKVYDGNSPVCLDTDDYLICKRG